MNVSRIIPLKQVKNDLIDGEQFYDLLQGGLGTYFRDSLISDIESLILYAGIHSKYFGFYRMLSAKFPFAIYYDIQNNTAIVVAVLDMRRNPASIREKLKQREF